MILLLITLTVNALLMLWFHTEAFLEYTQLIGFKWRSFARWQHDKMQEYATAVVRIQSVPAEASVTDAAGVVIGTVPEEDCATCKGRQKKTHAVPPRPNTAWMVWMVATAKDSFVKRLAVCPYCIGLWFSAFVAAAYQDLSLLLPAYFLSLTLFNALRKFKV